MKYRFRYILPFLFTVFLGGCSLGSMMMNETRSPYGFDTTVDTILTNAKTQGWMVPKVYDFQASLLKHDQIDPGRIKVLKLCHPEIASQMLANDENKYVSVMMPCSISVYEKQDGHVYVTNINMNLMSKMMGGEVGEILSRVADEDTRILRFLEH